MKHLLLILILLVAGYTFWNLSDAKTRKESSRFITKHGFRLGFMVLVVLLLLYAAAFLPSTQII